MAKNPGLPGSVNSWDMYAGGTAAPDGKHSYGFTTSRGNYKINVVCRGRHCYYTATFENVRGAHPENVGLHSWISPDGSWDGFPRHSYRSPNEAARAAKKHWGKYFAGASLKGLGIIPGIGVGTIAAGIIGYIVGRKGPY